MDTLCVAADSFVCFTVDQLHRQGGEDRRETPYRRMRAEVGVATVRLR